MLARPFLTTVHSAEALSPQVRLIRLEIEGDRLEFAPGQFLSINVPLAELGTENARSYSLASSPGDALLEIAVTLVRGGPASTWLHEVAPGTRLNASGPYGFFTLAEPPGAACFVATGTGVAPVRPMLRRVLSTSSTHAIDLLFGVRHEADILWRAEFEALARAHENFHFHPTLTQPPAGWTGDIGRVQALVDRLLVEPHRTDVDVYVCGLRRMVDDVRDRLKTAGWDRKRIHQERYD